MGRYCIMIYEKRDMANEDKKDFNAMLHESKDMPKIQVITDQKSIDKYGGDRMYFAKLSGADFTEPITAGIFVTIAAWASHQRTKDETPYWRTLKAKGELNPKYPGGVKAQKSKLEAEGHTIIQRGRTNIRYYVSDYEDPANIKIERQPHNNRIIILAINFSVVVS